MSEPVRRSLTERQTTLVQGLVDAAAVEVEEAGYDEITVRSIARRAGVAPATAYTYFSSKDHLLAEVLWQRATAEDVPDPDMTRPASVRVAQVVRDMGFGTGSPALVAACTTALLNNGPDVKAVRDKMGAEIARRLVTALGPATDPTVLRVLVITYTGAMLAAGLGHLTFEELPERVAEAARLLLGETS